MTTPRAAFTLVEMLAAGAVVLVLASVGAGTVGHFREQARAGACVSHLRQWGVALQGYVQDNDGRLPRRGQGVQPVWVVDRAEDWFNALPPYLGQPAYSELHRAGRAPRPGETSIFVCPSARPQREARHLLCYGMNMYLSRWDQAEPTRVSQVPRPGTLAVLADSPGGYASTVPARAAYSVDARHAGRANVLFADGHVRGFPGEHLGCGVGPREHADVRWRAGISPDDPWNPR